VKSGRHTVSDAQADHKKEVLPTFSLLGTIGSYFQSLEFHSEHGYVTLDQFCLLGVLGVRRLGMENSRNLLLYLDFDPFVCLGLV
jgi:hypothetical protein